MEEIKMVNKELKKNKIKIIISVAILILAVLPVMFSVLSKKSDVIPDNYIAVFHGGSGEKTYSTYIYKENNGHINSGFKYINTENTTEFYGSSNWISKITGKGTVMWTDDVFTVAEKNNAYSYVTLPNDKKTYTIEEFQSMFLMN